ncbi:hypothetical protein K3495_g17325, partial [Podosphaera aphanis]
MSKGKAAVRSMEEVDFDDEDEMDWEEMPQNRWGEPLPRRQAPESQTVLDWASFDWKPDQKSFLRGIENYSIYRETILLQLECIGFRTGSNLTHLDELKLAAVV